MNVELHFQDGFSGETVEVLVNGEVKASFTAKTRYQINLAHVQPVALAAGDRLTIRVKEPPASVNLGIESVHKYYVISWRAEKMLIEPTDELPKYM